MTVERASGDTDYTVDSVCNGTLSQKDITTGAATTTITITPDTGLCATGGGGGPGGSTPAPTSSGGGGGGAVVTTPAVTTPAAPAAPSAPSTQTTIATLLAQLQSLIALFQSLGGTVTPAMEAFASGGSSFTRDLKTGSTGEDVKALQVYLNTHGYVVVASGAGSPGSETSKFGALTRAALIKLQKAAGITPAAGYFGPKTRAYVNANP